MSDPVVLALTDTGGAASALLAGQLAARLRPGDVVALTGADAPAVDRFARHLVSALIGGEPLSAAPGASATRYDGPRFPVYAMNRAAGEIVAADGVAVVRHGGAADSHLPADWLDVAIAAASATLSGLGAWAPRVERFAALRRFMEAAGWGNAHTTYVNGDASTRSYARLSTGSACAILMDWPKAPDGPPIRGGRPYSQIAHLAEETRPFVAVAGALREAGLSAPRILAADTTHGFLLLEDFGDNVFTAIAARGVSLAAQYRLAVDVLLALRAHPPAAELRADSISHTLPLFDREALHIETELLTDWLLPAVRGGDVPSAVRAEFTRAWDEQFDWLLIQPTGWVLRDYHSPNLIWREGENGLRRLGVIDFQDAMRGHAAYDLVSLLQDARLDLPEDIEPALLAHYCEAAADADPAFDHAAFLRAYRLLGAQRNTKILGIFARLARRDGKRAYIRHMPRIARYLAADLADPALSRLRAWYERELPGEIAALTGRI